MVMMMLLVGMDLGVVCGRVVRMGEERAGELGAVGGGSS